VLYRTHSLAPCIRKHGNNLPCWMMSCCKDLGDGPSRRIASPYRQSFESLSSSSYQDAGIQKLKARLASQICYPPATVKDVLSLILLPLSRSMLFSTSLTSVLLSHIPSGTWDSAVLLGEVGLLLCRMGASGQ